LFGRIHSAQSVTLLWIAYRTGVEGIFPGGDKWIFPNVFLRGAKCGEICFLPLDFKKTAFFAEVFKFLPLFRHPYACV